MDLPNQRPSAMSKKLSTGSIAVKHRFAKGGGQDYLSAGDKFEITDEQTAWYTRMLFNDDVASLKRLTAEAKRACQFIGLSPTTLLKKDMEDIKNAAEPGIQPKVLEMRCHHQEARRRKRLRFLFEYVKANKQSLLSSL